jgi:hypothetical protein
MNIAFDAATHVYWINGFAVPNVTRVLGDLYNWDAVPAKTLERKRQIGAAVHRAIELDVHDDLDESSLDPQVAGYFEAWRRFCKERPFTCHLAEHQVGSHKLRYAGTLDLAGDLGGSDVLIDIKITHHLHPASALQTAAYLYAASEMRLIGAGAKRFALCLQADGAYRIQPHLDRNDFPVFVSCLSRHNWCLARGLIKEKQQ